jgi:3'-5' exoribonuclease
MGSKPTITPVRELVFGDCDATVIVKVLEPDLKKTSRGSDYVQFVGQDSSGTIAFKVWEPRRAKGGGYQEHKDLLEGRIVQCHVRNIQDFNGQRQIKTFTYDIIEEGDPRYAECAAQVRVGPTDAELDEYMGHVEKMLASIKHAGLRKATQSFLESNREEFRKCPASPHREGHHGYEGGMLKHTCDVMRLAAFHAKMVGKKFVSMDVVLAGAFLHDIGKFETYGLKLSRTTAGRLLGHVAIGLAAVSRLMEEHGVDGETSVMVQHIVVSHHGTREYGSPEKPQTIEAEIVCWADMADSKAEAVRMKLEGGLKPGEFAGNANYGVYTAYLPPGAPVAVGAEEE